MTLIIENVKKEYVEAFQGLANGVKANMKTLVECNDNNATTQGINNEVSHIDKTNHISENLTENGYTDEFEKELLADREQMQKEYENGNALMFESHSEFKRAVENGEIHNFVSQKVC